jgi:hypothetical protein
MAAADAENSHSLTGSFLLAHYFNFDFPKSSFSFPGLFMSIFNVEIAPIRGYQ